MQRGRVYMIKQRFKLQPIKNTLCGCRMLILPTCIITNCTASTLYCLVFLEVKKHPVECLPKRFPHYTLAQLGAYLCSFFSCWSKQQLVTLLWLIVSLFCPVLSFQRPWASSWPAAVPHPDTASNKSCQECVSTAVTQTCVTTPPHGVHEQSTVSVLCSASCCWGCGCDTFLVESNIKGIELQTEHFERGNSL